MLRSTASRQVSLTVNPHLGPKNTSLLQWQRLRVIWCRETFLPRGRVCPLQLLLFLFTAGIIESKSSRTQTHVLLSQTLESPNLDGWGPLYIPQEHNGFSYTHWPPLWSTGKSFWLLTQWSRVWFPELPDFLNISRSGTGSTQPLWG
jgi:hypothetical protein